MNLENSYKGFDNEKITLLAQYEAEKLTPEAVELLKKEIISRNLNPKLIEIIDDQIKGISHEDFFEYSKFLLQLPCPICGQRYGEIDITRKARVVSVLIFTGYDKILICGCKDCLKKEIKRTMIISLIIGWLGFPFGPIRTIQSLYYNLDRIKETKTPDQSEDFIKFAWANKGFIMTNLDNEDELFGLIKGINQ
jgi:hypothetical protein